MQSYSLLLYLSLSLFLCVCVCVCVCKREKTNHHIPWFVMQVNWYKKLTVITCLTGQRAMSCETFISHNNNLLPQRGKSFQFCQIRMSLMTSLYYVINDYTIIFREKLLICLLVGLYSTYLFKIVFRLHRKYWYRVAKSILCMCRLMCLFSKLYSPTFPPFLPQY
jgi:hypothetical protein